MSKLENPQPPTDGYSRENDPVIKALVDAPIVYKLGQNYKPYICQKGESLDKFLEGVGESLEEKKAGK